MLWPPQGETRPETERCFADGGQMRCSETSGLMEGSPFTSCLGVFLFTHQRDARARRCVFVRRHLALNTSCLKDKMSDFFFLKWFYSVGTSADAKTRLQTSYTQDESQLDPGLVKCIVCSVSE